MSARSSNRDNPGRDDRNQISHRKGKNKRKRFSEEPDFSIGNALSLVRQELPEFSLTSAARPASRDSTNGDVIDEKSSQEWQTIENGRPSKKAKKIPRKDSSNYPEIFFSKDARLQTQVKIGDLQNLVLYILADGTSPQFVSVRHRSEIRKVVVLMVPGLERDMFDDEGSAKKKRSQMNSSSPDYYYPERLQSEQLPISLKPLADMFE